MTKQYADLFNDMVKVLLENDHGLIERLLKHTNDAKVHASEMEKKKWNNSQNYKITADSGRQLINVSADGRIFDAIKDKRNMHFLCNCWCGGFSGFTKCLNQRAADSRSR
ncbi:hypothetical protein ACEQPO_23170 [Bacillus sp. SL00103]